MGTVRSDGPDGSIDISSEDAPGYEPIKERTYPVVEIFGPVLQGEGALIGVQTHFLRLGGCDYRCSWCDTPDAVLPERLKTSVTKMTELELRSALDTLFDKYPVEWLTISGGNPALFNCAPIISMLNRFGKKVAIETQGSVYSPWMSKLDLITISPKPPSSGMNGNFSYAALMSILKLNSPRTKVVIKIPIASKDDLVWSRQLLYTWNVECYVQPVRLPDSTVEEQLRMLNWLADEVMKDASLAKVRVLPQLHALMGMR